ncbi:MAG: hypothetical protein JNN30_01690 [Rhodanobacteraceae bacterium]|nr:hypothetical protein [Rhodanobacteraceae bacterium]
MNRLTAFFLICFMAGPVSAAPQLTLPGENFHGDEVHARDGEIWLALIAEHGAAKLEVTKLVVKAVNDPVLDGPDDKTGRSVTAPGINALVFLRGIAELKPGAIPAVVSDSTLLMIDGPLELRLDDKLFHLRPRCDVVKPNASIRCEVLLDDGAHAQPLFSTVGESNDDGTGFLAATLLFAGDLDHDGRIDLLMDTAGGENKARPTLFLSTAAKKGQHVAEVAQQELTGC